MKYLYLILLSLLFLSCSNKTTYYWPQVLIDHFGRLDKISLITDAVIIGIDSKGNRKLSKSKSILSNEHCFSAINSILNHKRYTVTKHSCSFQGAFISGTEIEDLDPYKKLLPFKVDTLLFDDSLSLGSFLLLHRALYLGMDNCEKSLSPNYLSSVQEIKKICSAVQNKVDTRYLLINNFYGVNCSKQEKISRTIGRAIVNSVFFVDMDIYPSAFKSYSFLVDLESTQVLWSKYYKSGSDVLQGSSFMFDLYQNKILNDLPNSPKVINAKLMKKI